MAISFQWHGDKARANLAKHGVSFEEAATVFGDPLAVIFPDEKHSIDEVRELIIGHTNKKRLLIVRFTERRMTIRIISARRATRKERKNYDERSQS